MKFDKWFTEHKLDAWIHNYFRFAKLKALLPNLDEFTHNFQAEVARVNSFYVSVLELHRSRWTKADEDIGVALSLEDIALREKELYSLKEVVEGTYTGLMHLQEYSFTNYRAATHLLVKLKKLSPTAYEPLSQMLLNVRTK